jgi:hypothetical protein
MFCGFHCFVEWRFFSSSYMQSFCKQQTAQCDMTVMNWIYYDVIIEARAHGSEWTAEERDLKLRDGLVKD